MGVIELVRDGRVVRLVVAVVVLLAVAILIAGFTFGTRSTPDLEASVDATPSASVIAPVLANSGVMDPERVSARDWVSVSVYLYELPAVETRPAPAPGLRPAGPFDCPPGNFYDMFGANGPGCYPVVLPFDFSTMAPPPPQDP